MTIRKIFVAGDEVTAAELNANFKFGGDGSDGALAISSGTTTVNLASAQYVILNYSSILITGTAKLAFSNPHTNGTIVIIKCQGNCTLTSSQTPMIDCSALGAATGANNPTGTLDDVTHYPSVGSNGNNNVGDNPGAGVTGPSGGSAQTLTSFYLTNANLVYRGMRNLIVGAPGRNGGTGGSGNTGSGGGTGGSGGAGGRGGGALYMEIGGAWNFTTSLGISVAGANGSNGSNGTNGGGATGGGAGGGGGGGGNSGMFVALVGSITANTGSVNTASGAGGNGGTGGSATPGSPAGIGLGGGSGGTGGPSSGGISGAGKAGASSNTTGGGQQTTGANGSNGTAGSGDVGGSGGSGGSGATGGTGGPAGTSTGGTGGAASSSSAGYSVITINVFFS